MDEATRAQLINRGEPLTDLAEKWSGADLDRVVLEDGRSFVLKHLPSAGDWLTRGTGGTGRMFLLWSSGILAAAGTAVDHAVVDCVETTQGWVVIMRDASSDLLPPRVPVPRATSRQMLCGLAALHAVPVERTVDGLCSVAARYGLFAPAFHRQDAKPGAHPMREQIVGGWERFFELVPEDVAAAVNAVHDDPAPIGRALGQLPVCLLHGDTKLENLGLAGERLVLIDWGDLTGFGPPEVDVAWYALKNAARVGGDPSDVFEDYEAESGRSLDERALDLACLGSLAQMGFRMANSATLGRPESQEIGRAHLDWWTHRVRTTLDSLDLSYE